MHRINERDFFLRVQRAREQQRASDEGEVSHGYFFPAGSGV